MSTIETFHRVRLCDGEGLTLKEGETFTDRSLYGPDKKVPAETLHMCRDDKPITDAESLVTADDCLIIAEMMIEAVNRMRGDVGERVALSFIPSLKVIAKAEDGQ